MNFRYRIMQFMSGRYGVDRLFYLIFGAAMVLSLINLFVRSVVLQLIVYALVIYALFRIFSRNTAKRSRENALVQEKLGLFRRKKEFHDRKKADRCHVYKKCPSCKAVLRLPRRIGVHKTVCPKCGNEFTVKVKK